MPQSAQRRHPSKSAQWVKDRYFSTVNGRGWIFSDGSYTLTTHSSVPIVRHLKVKGNKSPYDGDLLYWARRLGKHPQLPTAVAKLLKRQHGTCPHCGLVFREEDLWDIDHIVPLCKGGNSHYSNLQLLHRHCHHTKTASDGSIGCTSDKGQVIEEPDEANVSCPVLKTSGSCEGVA